MKPLKSITEQAKKIYQKLTNHLYYPLAGLFIITLVVVLMSVGADLGDIASVITAVGIACTAIVGIQSLHSWRNQLLGRKRIEIAEKTLQTFYEVREAIETARYLRVTLPVEEDLDQNAGQPGVSQGDVDLQKLYSVCLQRLCDKDEVFSRFKALRNQYCMYFGNEIDAPFDIMWEVRKDFIYAARMLIDKISVKDEPDIKDKRKEWKETIWYSGIGEDNINKKLASAIDEIEKICCPHLKP